MARRPERLCAASLPRLLALPLSGAAVLAVLTVAGPSSPAAADIRARIASAQARLQQLNAHAEAAAERYNAGRLQLAAARQQAAAAQHAAAAAAAQVAAMRTKVNQLAARSYTGGGLSTLSALVSPGGPQSVLDRLATLEILGHSQAHTLASFRAAQSTATRAATTARGAVAAAQAAVIRLGAEQRQIEGAAGQTETLLRQLQAQQAQLATAARDRAAKAAAAAQAAALGRQATATAAARRAFPAAAGGSGPPVASGVAAHAAQVAVATALAQLGKPYVWAAAGPNSFDCSGLTLYAYASAGIALPHFTGAQWNVGRHVSIGELRPGDLVFFYSDRHHMGMYIGGGRMVHAPHTGDVVKTEAMSGYWTSNFSGAVRVVG